MDTSIMACNGKRFGRYGAYIFCGDCPEKDECSNLLNKERVTPIEVSGSIFKIIEAGNTVSVWIHDENSEPYNCVAFFKYKDVLMSKKIKEGDSVTIKGEYLPDRDRTVRYVKLNLIESKENGYALYNDEMEIEVSLLEVALDSSDITIEHHEESGCYHFYVPKAMISESTLEEVVSSGDIFETYCIENSNSDCKDLYSYTTYIFSEYNTEESYLVVVEYEYVK